VNTGTYVVQHPEFGWLAFGGNIQEQGKSVKVTPLDSFRSRVYLAPFGLWLTLESGEFRTVEIDPKTHAVKIELAPATAYTPAARLRIEQPSQPGGVGSFQPSQQFASERGAFVVPLQPSATFVELAPAKN
jgi:hypothetical protein